MKKIFIVGAAVSAVALAGCASRIVGPVSYGDGTYLMASYSKTLVVEKVKMIEKASEFCQDQNKVLKIEEIWMTDRRTSQKVAVAVAQTITDAIYPRAGSIEIKFTCQ